MSELPPHDIIEVKTRGAYLVYLKFDDGTEGIVDLAQIVVFTGAFAALSEPSEFMRVHVDPELGTICWPNGADVAPDTLYAALKGIDLGAKSAFAEADST